MDFFWHFIFLVAWWCKNAATCTADEVMRRNDDAIGTIAGTHIPLAKFLSVKIWIICVSSVFHHPLLPLLLRHYDNRTIEVYEGPCGCPEEVSLTLRTVLPK
jgi:hypothetical protein